MAKIGIDRAYMKTAIALAKTAGERGEIPVGAVIVKDGTVIGTGFNRREETGNVLSHAEVDAISAACETVGDWRLDGCTLYVTMEPCPMCAGAILNARISTVVFGAYDLHAGSFGSVTDLSAAGYESHPEIYGGICEDECAALLSRFFETIRKESR